MATKVMTRTVLVEKIPVVFRRTVGQGVWTSTGMTRGFLTLFRWKDEWEANYYLGEIRTQALGRTMSEAASHALLDFRTDSPSHRGERLA